MNASAPDVRRGLVAALLLSTGAFAQDRLYTHDGSTVDSGYGFSVAGISDVDGDTVADYLIGSMGCISANGGTAEVVSGATGALVRSHSGVGCYGMSVAGLCDLDGDGVDEYAVSAIRADSSLSPKGGLVWIYSGVDGSVVRVLEGDSVDGRFGLVIDAVGDFDGDGRCEVLVTSPWDSTHGPEVGSADVFSGGTGEPLLHLDGEGAYDWFGFGAATVGDLDGDLVDDLAIGAPYRWYNTTGVKPPGHVRVHSGQSGALLWSSAGTNDADCYGTAVAAIEDLDGDGHGEVLIGVPRHRESLVPGGTTFEVGAVEVRSGADGTLLFEWFGGLDSKYGTSVRAAGDLDGDGTADVLVGACYCQNSKPLGPGDGWVEVRSGADGALLSQLVDGDDLISFAYSVAPLGDITRDGVPDFIVGNTFDDAVGFKTGSAWVYSGASLSLQSSLHELPIDVGGAQALELDAGTAHAGALFLVLGSFAGTEPGLDLGAAHVPLNLDDYLLFTGSQPVNTILTGGFGSLDDDGRASVDVLIPSASLPAGAAGLVAFHAFVTIDLDGTVAFVSNPASLILL